MSIDQASKDCPPDASGTALTDPTEPGEYVIIGGALVLLGAIAGAALATLACKLGSGKS